MIVAKTKARPDPWSESERAEFKVPPRLSPSEWVEANRILPEEMADDAGPLNMDKTPYWREVIDTAADPSILEITIVKAVQTGGSEATRSMICYWIDQDPGPCLLVFPVEDACNENMADRIQPAINASPTLARHKTNRAADFTKTRIRVDSMAIYGGWANSAQSLATRPCRYVVLDETDKYPAFAGREADPIRLAEKRTTTYGHRAKRVKVSTPTTREGHIMKAWENTRDRRTFHIPCPRCGEYQALTFAQVVYPDLHDQEPDKIARAERIEVEGLAEYECKHCEERFADHEKAAVMLKGVWASEGQTVEKDGNLVGTRPKARRVAFRISALYSPWVSFSETASAFIRAEGELAALIDFRNAYLAEPWEEQVQSNPASRYFKKRKAGHAPGIVPAWAGMVLMTVDTQKDHFWGTIRAWGYEWRSRLLWEGRLATFGEVTRAHKMTWPLEWEPNYRLATSLVLIDSGGGTETDTGGSRTDEVYRYCKSNPILIRPTKGASHTMHAPVVARTVKYKPPGGKAQPYDVRLHLVDTGLFKDILIERVLKNESLGPDDLGEPGAWELHSDASDDYCKQMASEHKIVVRKGAGTILRWEPITDGAANHIWDCEVLQCVAATMKHAELLPPPQELQKQIRSQYEQQPTRGKRGKTW